MIPMQPVPSNDMVVNKSTQILHDPPHHLPVRPLRPEDGVQELTAPKEPKDVVDPAERLLREVPGDEALEECGAVFQGRGEEGAVVGEVD